jgi:hypothetical protein
MSTGVRPSSAKMRVRSSDTGSVPSKKPPSTGGGSPSCRGILSAP